MGPNSTANPPKAKQITAQVPPTDTCLLPALQNTCTMFTVRPVRPSTLAPRLRRLGQIMTATEALVCSMSSKNKKIPRTSLPSRQPSPPTDADESTDAPETGGELASTEFHGLSLRQQSVLPIVAFSRTVTQASRDAGVSEKTIRKWLDDPAFRRHLDTLRAESYDIARGQFKAFLPHCVSIIAEMAAEAEDPALRLRAANYLLNYGVKFVEIDQVYEEMKSIRQSVAESK